MSTRSSTHPSMGKRRALVYIMGGGIVLTDRLLTFARLGGCCRNLTAWAQNGVLLLNTCLTVKAREPGSHSNEGWEQFTDRVVDVVDKYGGANLAANGSILAGRGRGIVFLAWGAWAAKRVAKLDKVRLPRLVPPLFPDSRLSFSLSFFIFILPATRALK